MIYVVQLERKLEKREAAWNDFECLVLLCPNKVTWTDIETIFSFSLISVSIANVGNDSGRAMPREMAAITLIFWLLPCKMSNE